MIRTYSARETRSAILDSFDDASHVMWSYEEPINEFVRPPPYNIDFISDD